jgi:hypothetical protein
MGSKLGDIADFPVVTSTMDKKNAGLQTIDIG